MSKVEDEVRLWDQRIESVIADPNSSLEPADYLSPMRLLKRTAEAYDLRRPRKDSRVGKQVVEIAKGYTETPTQSRRTT